MQTCSNPSLRPRKLRANRLKVLPHLIPLLAGIRADGAPVSPSQKKISSGLIQVDSIEIRPLTVAGAAQVRIVSLKLSLLLPVELFI